jgi:hypothetical protein
LSGLIVAACSVTDEPAQGEHCSDSAEPNAVCGAQEYCVEGDCEGKLELTDLKGCYTALQIEAAREKGGKCKIFGDISTDTDDVGSSWTSTSTTTSSTSTTSSSSSSTTSTSSDDTSSTSSTDGKCHGDEDCTDEGQTVCDVESGECVECLAEGSTQGCTDEVCSDSHTCVACVADENCNVGGMMGVCLVDVVDAENNRCADCRANENCTEDAERPTCDLATFECRACGGETIVEELECGQGACIPWDMDNRAGQCASDVIWVSGTNCDDANDGDENTPLCTVAAAIEKAQTGELLTIRIKNDYEATQDESLLVSSGKEIALIGAVANGARIEMLKGDVALGASALKVIDTGKVWVRGLSWTNYAKDGVECKGESQVWMENVRLQTKADVPGTGSGVNAKDCHVQVKRGEILGNEMYGVKANGGEVWLENVIVAKNGTTSAEAGGIHLGGGGVLHMNHVTVAENSKSGGEGFNIFCAQGASTLEIRNSLVVGAKTDSFNDCSMATLYAVEQSIIDDGDIAVTAPSKILSASDANAVIHPMNGVFEDTANFNYRLKSSSDHLSKLAGVVTHAATDPTVDIDGSERPAEGQADYPGADQPQ